MPVAKKSPVKDESVVLGSVKQLIRGISLHNTSNHSENVWKSIEVDKTLSEYADKGYKLINTHMVGQWNEAMFFFYVLVLEK